MLRGFAWAGASHGGQYGSSLRVRAGADWMERGVHNLGSGRIGLPNRGRHSYACAALNKL